MHHTVLVVPRSCLYSHIHISFTQVPTGYKATSVSAGLDRWIGKQRGDYKQNKLSKNKVRQLEELGLDLSARKKKAPDYNGQQWEKTCNELETWV